MHLRKIDFFFLFFLPLNEIYFVKKKISLRKNLFLKEMMQIAIINYLNSYNEDAINFSKNQRTNDPLYTYINIRSGKLKNGYIKLGIIDCRFIELYKARYSFHIPFFRKYFKEIYVYKNGLLYYHYKYKPTIPIIFHYENKAYAIWLIGKIIEYLLQNKLPKCIIAYIFELCLTK